MMIQEIATYLIIAGVVFVAVFRLWKTFSGSHHKSPQSRMGCDGCAGCNTDCSAKEQPN